MIWNPPVETMDRASMAELQLSRLQQVVQRVWERVPFMRQRLEQRGVRPEHVRSLEDLRLLPFTTKQDLWDNYPFGLLAEPRGRLARVHASSGTRGRPTVVAYTRADVEMWAESCARAFCLAGGEPGHVLHNAYGYGLFTGGLGLHYGAERVGACVVPASVGNTLRQVSLIADFRPDGICCTPSYLVNLIEFMESSGRLEAASSLRYAILGAEPWSESMRAQIEQAVTLDAVDIYGLSEVVGPGVACECREAKQGLHVCEDLFLPEVVDPKTGEPLGPGEYGELVFTTLAKEALPLIRYRTGDIAALFPEPCRCGRTSIRMSRVKGRVDDMLIIRGINVFPSEVEYQLLQVRELAPHYQLVASRNTALDRLTVLVEPVAELARAWGGVQPGDDRVEELRRQVADRLYASLGIRVQVEVLPPGSIPRSEGKATRVVDRRPEAVASA